MTYESWRITYQCSEQAARAAFFAYQKAMVELDRVTEELDALKKGLSCGCEVNGGAGFRDIKGGI